MPKIIYFHDDDGIVPILEWLDNLPRKAFDKCTAQLERLQEYGNELRRPAADYLCDGIYELRIQFQGIQYRILYFFFKNLAVVISHGITKKKRVPPGEIERAKERKAKFESSPNEHGYEV